MTEELKQAVESGQITETIATALGRLAPGAFCQHKSWGFGRVAGWNLLGGQILIDFGTRKQHPMQVQYAAETLTPIPEGHILARKATAAGEVRQQALAEPLAVARQILSDLGGRATADQILATLQPEVFSAVEAKKWLETAKKKMKADGHFALPAKKTEPFVLLETAVSAGDGLIEKFRSARHLKDQILALDLITKALDDLAKEIEELRVLATQIEESAQKGRKLQPAAAVELLIARDEIVARHDALALAPDAPRVADILVSEDGRLAVLFESLPASKHRRTLQAFEAAFGDRWTDKAVRLMRESNARLVVEIYRLFEQAGRLDFLQQTLARWISERSISTEVLIWLCRERGAAFPELFNPELLASVFSALEQDQLNEKRGSRLQDLLVDDKTLLADLLEGADRDTARNIMRKLILTPVFDDLSKRSLMARIVKKHPETQNLITGDAPEARDENLTVSWPSLEKRKDDYEYLVQREIPQNLRDINVAKEQGDLRENFGFKAAKEQQRVLQRRKVEAERDLALARGTSFENPDTTQVSIGTVVTLESAEGTETYSILGAWDSAPDLGIVSYKAAIGQSLLGHKAGEEVSLPAENGARTVRIAKIAPFTDHDVLSTKVHVIRTWEAPKPAES